MFRARSEGFPNTETFNGSMNIGGLAMQAFGGAVKVNFIKFKNFQISKKTSYSLLILRNLMARAKKT